MHRRVLVIEIPERQPPKLHIAPTLSVERPEINIPLQQPVLQQERRKLTISESPRVFYSYDDSNESDDQNDTVVDDGGPLEEEIITL